MMLVGTLPGALRRCFRMKIRGTIWVAWSTLRGCRNLIVPWSSK
jgi:hypothetical protein